MVVNDENANGRSVVMMLACSAVFETSADSPFRSGGKQLRLECALLFRCRRRGGSIIRSERRFCERVFYAGQSEVIGHATVAEYGRIDTEPVVAEAEAQFEKAEVKLDLDFFGVGMTKGIEQASRPILWSPS